MHDDVSYQGCTDPACSYPDCCSYVGADRMSARRFSDEELALAYELRQEGCCWKNIARGLGCEAGQIREAVNYVVREGLR